MISYIHVPVLAICFLTLLFMRRWWQCIDRLGFTREVGRRAPSLVQGDILAATLAILPFLIAAVDWSGVVLPGQSVPTSSWMAVVLSLSCLGGCVFVLRDSDRRFAGSWAGTRESALRTVAALRIIDAAELAHALGVLQQHEGRDTGGRTIEVNAQEMRK
ncbi:hypothetical protein D3C87_1155370 [compost metagenome]